MALLELTLLGTGTSGCLPAISCITDPSRGCECCLSTQDGSEDGKKNVRRNTSAFLRVMPDGKSTRSEDIKTILIDCGKSFLTSALEWFPKRGFRKIDALVRRSQIYPLQDAKERRSFKALIAPVTQIITHPHSDAMSGLDDLRGWTLGGAIQDTMDVYVTKSTFKEIERTYPYLVSKHLATGGGDVPAMNYIIFDENATFDVCGVTVTPLPVHHGWYFTKQEPYYCLGFLFNRSLAYISDVSYIPDETWKLLEGRKNLDAADTSVGARASAKSARDVERDIQSSEHINGSAVGQEQGTVAHTNGHFDSEQTQAKIPVLLIDCLRVHPHTSHFGIAQAMATARRLQARRNYMLGFAHRVLHSTWEKVCLAIEAGERPKMIPDYRPGGLQQEAEKLSYGAFNPKMKHSDVPDELKEIALQTIEEWEGGNLGPVWMRPAFDGQTIWIDEATGKCWDSEYATEAC